MSKLLTILLFVIFTTALAGRKEDSSHQEGDDSSHYEYEPLEFDHDPHEGDSDYDEDVLTGTSHHSKMSEEETKKELDDLFKQIDTNADGKIDRPELISHLIISMKKLHNESSAEEFAKVDKDEDHKVSLDEYFLFEHGETVAAMDNYTATDNSTEAQEMKKRLQHDKDRFKAADNDNDGFLDEHEYIFFKYPVFFPHMAHTIVHDYIEDLDANTDGLVDVKEYVDHFHISDNKNKTEAEKSLQKAYDDFAKYDKDSNGKIDPEEYFAVLRPGYDDAARSEADYLFSHTNTGKDGVLTLAEVEKHAQMWLGQPLGSSAADDDHHGDDDDDDDDDDHSHHLDDEL